MIEDVQRKIISEMKKAIRGDIKSAKANNAKIEMSSSLQQKQANDTALPLEDQVILWPPLPDGERGRRNSRGGIDLGSGMFDMGRDHEDLITAANRGLVHPLQDRAVITSSPVDTSSCTIRMPTKATDAASWLQPNCSCCIYSI